MNKILFLLKLPLHLGLYTLTKVIPKNKKLWVFGAWFGAKFSDNPKAFFEYITSEQKQIDAIWLSKDIHLVNALKNQGVKACYVYSLVGVWLQMRADMVFICQSVQDDLYAPSISKKTKLINLWHGIPLKKIMFDVFGDKKKNKNLVGKVVDLLRPYEKYRNDYIVATSGLTQKLLSKAFRVDIDKTLLCGFPRNDVFYKKRTSGTDNTTFNCIYMPTFRGKVGSECDLFYQYGFDFKKIEKKLIENGINLTLRMHPVNTPPESLINKISQSSVIFMDERDDIYESITDYDCLITDYSSIYFDFLLSDNPIIFAPFDLEQYKDEERSLYFDFRAVTLEPYCLSWNEIIDRLITLKKQANRTLYEENYQRLKSKFHSTYADQEYKFSKQLFQKIKEL